MACNIAIDIVKIFQSVKQSISRKFWVTSVIGNAPGSSYLPCLAVIYLYLSNTGSVLWRKCVCISTHACMCMYIL